MDTKYYAPKTSYKQTFTNMIGVVTWFFASNTLSFLVPPVSAFRPKMRSAFQPLVCNIAHRIILLVTRYCCDEFHEQFVSTIVRLSLTTCQNLQFVIIYSESKQLCHKICIKVSGYILDACPTNRSCDHRDSGLTTLSTNRPRFRTYIMLESYHNVYSKRNKWRAVA